MKIFRNAYALATVLAIGGLASCKGSEAGRNGGATGGTIVISAGADAETLFPPLVTGTQARQVTEQVFEPLADIGDAMNDVGDEGFVPKLADSWTWAPDSLSLAFHLNPNARWHDGVPVTARDVRFSLQLFRDPKLASPQAALLPGVDSISVRDSLTPVVWFSRRSPRAFYTAASQLLIMPEHVYGKIPAESLATSELARTPVGSGPFKFVRWVPNASLELAANTAYYRHRAGVDRLIWTIAPGDFTTAVARVMGGDADVFETLRPETINQAKKGNVVQVVMYPGIDFGMMLFNLRDTKTHTKPHPLFGDRMLRRALTMAIDRNRLVTSVFDSVAMPALGPTVRALATTDPALAQMQIPYDTAAAAQLLDSLGWRDVNHTGIRKKGNIPLSFTVVTPTSSKNREQCAVLMQEQFRKIGVQMNIQPMEMAALVQHEDARDFDAAMLALHLIPSPTGLKQSWSAAEAENAKGTNYGAYANPRFDAQVDSALAITSPSAARQAFTKAYQTIIDDAPAIWLYDLRGATAVNKRIHVATLRSDAWWAHLAEWSIPADQRIARDRVPAQGQ